ncbi:MAG TPA: hypothetical protein VIY29_15190, partial [Ktedonobacteraceae bacterium]
AKASREPSLVRVLKNLEDSWLRRLDDHPVVQDQRNMAYRDSITKGIECERKEALEEGRGRSGPDKGKGRACSAGPELEALQKKHDDVVRANAVLVAERRTLEQERNSLLDQLRALEREFERLPQDSARLSRPAGTGMPVAGIGIPYHLLRDQDVPMDPVAGPSSAVNDSYAAAVKRKPTATPEGQAPKKRQRQARMTFRDPRSGLPVPLHPGGNPHFDGGAWSKALSTCPGEQVDEKIRWLCTNRHLPLFKRVTDELRQFVQTGGVRNLGPHQKLVWRAKEGSWSLRELALVNPQKAHPGLRWDAGVPNDADLVTWSLVKCLNAGKPEQPGRRAAIREALAAAVESLDYWKASGTQSTGLRPEPLPLSEAVTPGTVARHLAKCGVTGDYVTSNLRPFLQRAASIINQPSAGSSPRDANHVHRQLAMSTATSAAPSAAASAGSPLRDAEMAEASTTASRRVEQAGLAHNNSTAET